MRFYSIIFVLVLFTFTLKAQVEHIPITSPVYDFLLRAENKGYLEHKSLSDLPLQKKEIISILNQMYLDKNLSSNDKNIVEFYLREFNVLPEKNAVLFENEQNQDNELLDDIFSSKDKYFYLYSDSVNSVEIEPLAKLDIFSSNNKKYENDRSILLQGGARLSGTLDNSLGFYLQATNGTILSGDRRLAIDRDITYGHNVKFADLKSDLDFTQSHLIYDKNWFFASIGREYRNLGAGLFQKIFVSNSSQPYDAISLGARFGSFEYKFTHGSLLAGALDSNILQGFNTTIPDKFLVMHRFAFRPSWGEISLWESVIYSNRSIDFGYLNPLSFLKSLEHALRDRDNSLMGFDATIRPFSNFQVKGSFLLDDIIIADIGKGYWSNKTAWNIASTYSFDFPIDIGVEYSRVEPYTYSHFNPLNTYSSDRGLLGSIIQPNSDMIGLLLNYWIGDKYPLTFKYIRKRHGENIYKNGELIENVGGDINQTIRPQDKYYGVKFLDGNKVNTNIYEFSFGYEIIRNFNIKADYALEYLNGVSNNYFRFILTLEDF